ncbi:hypothetical protein [Aliiroseovarius marinus]|uniref:hypothetical protein n=1 Tax=Aliiroseovarius marinus TaxID=2500159 RepID=UPI003D7E8AB9
MPTANTLPPTPKQVDYARAISTRLGEAIPAEMIHDRAALSGWIGAHQAQLKARSAQPRDSRATSRQVAYAERIARAKRRSVPDECFRDAGLMSAWISSNR